MRLVDTAPVVEDAVHVGVAVSQEHVGGAVSVAGHEVRGARVERDEAAGGADGCGRAVAVAFCPGVAEADSRRRAGLGIAHEHVDGAVGVAGDQVGRLRREGDVASVGAERAQPAPGLALSAAGGDAHARDEGLCPGKCRRADGDEHERREAAWVEKV
jgi:hypothetical protein